MEAPEVLQSPGRSTKRLPWNRLHPPALIGPAFL